jgi:putative oxidoreductase
MAPVGPLPHPVDPRGSGEPSRGRATTSALRSEPGAPVPGSDVRQRVIRWLRWVLVLVFVGAATLKFIGFPPTVALFDIVGLGQWFRYAVAAYELTGAVLLAYSRTTAVAAIGLVALMLGACATEVLVLQRPPLSSGATLAGLLVLVFLVRGRGSHATP